MNNTLKRQIISAVITFIGSFAAMIGVLIANGTITADNLGTGIAVSAILVAVRAAFKAVFESWFGLSGDPTVTMQ